MKINHINIRQATINDIDSYLKLQRERWRDDNMASREQLVSRLQAYPRGMLVAEREGEVVGMVYAMRITDYDFENPPSWNEITNNGFCDNADPAGRYIFGVDLSTAKGVGHLAGDLLLMGVGQLAVSEGVAKAMLGGRLPGYHQYAQQMTADEYLRAKDEQGKPLDRQVRYYTGVPGLVAVKTIKDYFHDPDSLDYGVLLLWTNPFYGWPGRKILSYCFKLVFRLEELYIKLAQKN